MLVPRTLADGDCWIVAGTGKPALSSLHAPESRILHYYIIVRNLSL